MKNPNVSLCKDLFQCFGVAENLGNPKKEENRQLARELRQVFYMFYDKHVNENNPHTCILKVKLKTAAVFTKAQKYVIDFEKKMAEQYPFVDDIEY